MTTHTSRAPSALVLAALAGLATAAVPLPASPSWTSSDGDYSTGGAFADVDTNGFIDLCTSNGNDMALDQNSVYLNHGGTLETVASWRSTDNGYFGHCYSGDINNDGLPDLAVGYLGSGGSGELTAKVYENLGSGLSPTPSWHAGDRHSSFDCCLGDVDLDGDLDLAISAGDAYSSEIDSVRIYRNQGGVLDTLPVWTAQEGTASDAVRFCDIDNDGDLDLFVGQRRRISMYRNNSGTLETSPSWVARQNVGWVLRLAFGDYDRDGFLDLAAAANDQLGDPNSIKVFHNSAGTLDTIATFNMLRQGSQNYSSCVAWADVNDDGWPDLAAGGWWRPAVVFENRSGTLDTVATWSWSPSNRYDLVCEAVLWCDVDNSHLRGRLDEATGNGQRHLFTIRRLGPLQSLDSVRVNGTLVPGSEYCYDLVAGWVSFEGPPPDQSDVEFFTRVSTNPDLVVTNWDQSHGNFMFLNSAPVGAAAHTDSPQLPRFTAWPNPGFGMVCVRLSGSQAPASSRLSIYSRDGRLVRTLTESSRNESIAWQWVGTDERDTPVPAGVYFAAAGDEVPRLKLVRIAVQ